MNHPEDRRPDVNTPEHRAKIADRWKDGVPKSDHIRHDEPVYDDHVYPADRNHRLDHFIKRLIAAEVAAKVASEVKREAEAMAMAPTVKKMFDWTVTPTFILSTVSGAVLVLMWVISSIFGQQQSIHDNQVAILQALATMKENKETAEARAGKYIAVIEGLTKSETVQQAHMENTDSRVQLMGESIQEQRKTVNDAFIKMAESISKLSEEQYRTGTQVEVVRNQLSTIVGERERAAH